MIKLYEITVKILEIGLLICGMINIMQNDIQRATFAFVVVLILKMR
jgi:hypothetical protein